MRIMITLLIAIGMSGAATVGLIAKKVVVASDKRKSAAIAAPGTAGVDIVKGRETTSVPAGDPSVAGADSDDEIILKLLAVTNEHVSKLEQRYEQERRLTVDSLRSSRDAIMKFIEARGPLDLKAAADAGKKAADGVQTKLQSVFVIRREFNTALAELPEVYIKAAEYFRRKGTNESARMAEVLELRAVAVRNQAHLPGLSEKSQLESLPTMAAFFSEFGTTFGQEPKAVTRLSDSGPHGEAALLRTKLDELSGTIYRLLGSLTGGVTAPSMPVGVTAKQQEALPLWEVTWFAFRPVEGGVLVDELHLNRDGTFVRRYYMHEQLAALGSRIVYEEGRFTFVDKTLSFWNGDKLAERGRVEGVSSEEFTLLIDMPSATLPTSAARQINYRRLVP